MIRFSLYATLLGLILLLAGLPSSYPARRFLDHVQVEFAKTSDALGRAHAVRAMARMLTLQVSDGVPITPTGATSPPAEPAISQQLARTTARFFGNPYFRAADALLGLASFRAAIVIEWLPAMAVFFPVILLDGAMVRHVKSKEFRQHDPEWFAIHGTAAFLILCGGAATLFLPMTIRPCIWPLGLLAASVSLSRTLACFHRQG